MTSPTLDEDGNPTGQVEIIGWLYQYYNTEPKNAAFAKNGKITKEEIPAVTQLFTRTGSSAIWSKTALAVFSSTSGKNRAFMLTVAASTK